MVQELVDGGTFLLNCPWDMEGLEKHLPGQVKKFIADPVSYTHLDVYKRQLYPTEEELRTMEYRSKKELSGLVRICLLYTSRCV